MNDYLLLPHAVSLNIYVRELARAYQRCGVRVVLNADNLAELDNVPRWLHLQWPEEHYRWHGQGNPADRAQEFMRKLRWLHEQGTKIAWTVHNLIPHEHRDNPVDRAAYEAVLQCADVVVHHCDESVNLFCQAYPMAHKSRHIVCPHGHFMAYPTGISRADARKQLRLTDDALVFLQFGQVRAYKGLSTMLDAFRRCSVPRKQLLIAGRYTAPTGSGAWQERVRLAWLKRASSNVHLHLHEIPNEDVQVFMAAADVLVLTHSAGLNSGVAILGMSFGKPVVGPSLGCVPSVLNAGRNFVYPTDDSTALIQAMEQASRADFPETFKANREATARWSWDSMASTILAELRIEDQFSA